MSAFRNGALGWAAALLLAAGFAALGQWQYGRAGEKERLLADAAGVLATRDPVPLGAAADAGRAGRLDWAAGSGRFADAPAFLLDNQRHDGRVGVRAYRVFRSDAGAALLVDLGWLPIGAGRAMPQVPTPGRARATTGGSRVWSRMRARAPPRSTVRWHRACCASTRRCPSATRATSNCCRTRCGPNGTSATRCSGSGWPQPSSSWRWC